MPRPRSLAPALALALLLLGPLALAPAAAQVPEGVRRHILEGEKRFRAGDLKGALAAFEQALALDPKSGVAYYCRGTARLALGQRKEAIADFTECIHLIPGYHQAYHQRAVAYGDQKEWKKALADVEEAVRLRPEYAQAHYTKATILGNLGEDEEAIADCTEAIRLQPKFAQAFYARGCARLRLGKVAEALTDLEHALKLREDIAAFHTARADALARLDRLADAAAAYGRALSIGRPGGPKGQKLTDKAVARTTAMRGLVRWLAGDEAGGAADLKQGHALEPEFQYTPLWIFALTGERKPLEGVEKVAPAEPEQQWIKNVVLHYLGRIDEAELLKRAEAGQDAKERASRLCEAYCFLALLAERKRDQARAKDLYQRSVDTKVVRYTEHLWSRVRLQKLAGGR